MIIFKYVYVENVPYSHLLYLLFFRSVRVSRKFWHMLVNLCFHVSLTCGVFVGGINQTHYASVCQAVSTHHLPTFKILLCFSVILQLQWPQLTCFENLKQENPQKSYHGMSKYLFVYDMYRKI